MDVKSPYSYEYKYKILTHEYSYPVRVMLRTAFTGMSYVAMLLAIVVEFSPFELQ